MALMLVGIGYFAVITGAIAERFIERGEEERVEAVEADAPTISRAQVDRLALRRESLPPSLRRCGTRSQRNPHQSLSIPNGAAGVAPQGLRASIRRGPSLTSGSHEQRRQRVEQVFGALGGYAVASEVLSAAA